MSDHAQDPIRKLAEEIADAGGWSAPYEERRNRVEHLIRSALPSHAQLFGELAVKTAALERISAAECDGDMDVGCINFDPSTVHYCAPCEAQAALTSEAGRLAGEALRAVVEESLAEDARARLCLGPQADAADGVVCEARHRRRLAVDALLSAFPGLREEVER